MNQSIQDRLVRDYPFLKSVESFGCGDGWYNLLDQLCQSIQSQLIVSGNVFFRVTHVREKFGRLRVDFVFGDPEITRITETASKISAKTCKFVEPSAQPFATGTSAGFTSRLTVRPMQAFTVTRCTSSRQPRTGMKNSPPKLQLRKCRDRSAQFPSGLLTRLEFQESRV